MTLVTIEELERYATGRTLTPFQKRMVASLRELMRQTADLTAENKRLSERVAGLEEYDTRSAVKPTILLVQDLSQHGSVTAYEVGGVNVIQETVYPWEASCDLLQRLGRQWIEAPVVACCSNPYAETMSAARALELESKRATIEGCKTVIEMKQAIADSVDLIRELAPYKDKYLKEVGDAHSTRNLRQDAGPPEASGPGGAQ